MASSPTSSIDIKPYAVLGLLPPETADEPFDMAPISKAYRRLSLIYHPDKNDTEEARLKFAEVQAAYMTLSDDAKRAEYFKTFLFGDSVSHENRVAALQQAAMDAEARLAKRRADAESAEAARVAAAKEQQRQRAAASSGLGNILHSAADAIEKEILARWEVDSLDVLEAKEAEVMARLERLERGVTKRARDSA